MHAICSGSEGSFVATLCIRHFCGLFQGSFVISLRRLDSDSEEGQLIVTDYKTGSSPKSIYSAAMNEQIREEAFEQLRM
eukprot:5451759-Pleurochrysis_carterae.AAC.1